MLSAAMRLVTVNPGHRALTVIEFVGGLLLLLALAVLVICFFGAIGMVMEKFGLKLFLIPVGLIVVGGIFANGIVIGIGIGLVVVMIIGLMALH